MAVDLVTGTFEPRVGEEFHGQPTYSGDPVVLTLTRVDESPHARPDHPAFSLLFLAADETYREQQIFGLTNDALGEFELFLVPLGPQEGRMRYEAVVN